MIRLSSNSIFILDFDVRGSYFYTLGNKTVEIFDFTDPGEPRKISSINLLKDAHDIIFHQNKLYILDNVVVPLYLHIVEVEEPADPKISTFETWGINARLVTQALGKNWFVVMLYAHRGGGGADLLVFTTEAPIQEVGRTSCIAIHGNKESR